MKCITTYGLFPDRGTYYGKKQKKHEYLSTTEAIFSRT